MKHGVDKGEKGRGGEKSLTSRGGGGIGDDPGEKEGNRGGELGGLTDKRVKTGPGFGQESHL